MMSTKAQPLGAIEQPRAGQIPETYPRNRVCQTDGCETQLSQYNGSTRCAVHSRPIRVRMRYRSQREAFMEALLELMEEP